ncbi:hypothetical protein AALA56_04525 [Streptococcus hyointestinalis]|uniref:hypothetical protein n=1 Tax=Streptococcus hyointestinalis TaxID=1337 RepID=UPI003514FF5E
MKKNKVFMVHDDTGIYDVKQLSPEQKEIYDNLPEVFSKEELTQILLDSVIS